MNRNLNIFLWVIFFALMAPSGMVLASWNAVPGDNTYSLKLAMEKVLLLVISPSSELQSTTNSKLTERRMGEATKVLSGVHAKESLDNLTMQIEATRKSLSEITDEDAKKEAIAKYIETLHTVTSQLEEQKVNRAVAYLPPQQKSPTSYKITNPRQNTTVATSNPAAAQPVINNVTNNYYYQKPAVAANNPTAAPTTQQPTITQPTSAPTFVAPTPDQPSPQAEEVIQPEVVEDINDTQDEIDQVIEELEIEAQNIPSATQNDNNDLDSQEPANNDPLQDQQQNQNSDDKNDREKNNDHTENQNEKDGTSETDYGE